MQKIHIKCDVVCKVGMLSMHKYIHLEQHCWLAPFNCQKQGSIICNCVSIQIQEPDIHTPFNFPWCVPLSTFLHSFNICHELLKATQSSHQENWDCSLVREQHLHMLPTPYCWRQRWQQLLEPLLGLWIHSWAWRWLRREFCICQVPPHIMWSTTLLLSSMARWTLGDRRVSKPLWWKNNNPSFRFSSFRSSYGALWHLWTHRSCLMPTWLLRSDLWWDSWHPAHSFPCKAYGPKKEKGKTLLKLSRTCPAHFPESEITLNKKHPMHKTMSESPLYTSNNRLGDHQELKEDTGEEVADVHLMCSPC